MQKEEIKTRIRKNVKIIDTSKLEFCNVLQYEHMVENNIWTKAIQTAIDEKKNVYIPYIGHEILLDGSIFMDSNTNLRVDKKQVIRLAEKSNVCMVRNRNMIPGGHAYTEQAEPDENITIDGGIWAAPDNDRLMMDKYQTIKGGFAQLAFSNVRNVNITNAVFSRGTSFAVMISNCTGFFVDNIGFDNFGKDGIHINGPARYGMISNLGGEGLGDDMVALNAWDWYASSVTMGDIEDVIVENVQGDNNEIRLLAGRKIYPNGRKHDCDIRRVVFENISGIYTYKMYYQPYYLNVAYGKGFDSAETVGNMEDIWFENITVPKIKDSGFNNIPVYGVFDILTDGRNLNFANIAFEQTLTELDSMNIKLINVGPISATFKYTDDKANWGDYFEPDMCCTVEDINLENVVFAGEKITEAEKLVKETHQTINDDYPNTLPQGGTGYGKINKVTVR